MLTHRHDFQREDQLLQKSSNDILYTDKSPFPLEQPHIHVQGISDDGNRKFIKFKLFTVQNTFEFPLKPHNFSLRHVLSEFLNSYCVNI